MYAAYSLVPHADAVNQLMRRNGVRFGIGHGNQFEERIFPFDPIPRVIEHDEWTKLEAGLKQRVDALNRYLFDIYHEKRIVADGVVPGEFAFSGTGYLTACEGIDPPKKIMSHISGIDLVQDRSGEWFILEDNLRIPSGASYPLIARELTRRCSPRTFRESSIVPTANYGQLLRETMDYVNCGGIDVILTPGRYNSAFFEHSYLAEKSGARLAFPGELFVEDDKLYFEGVAGKRERVGALYRRISDEYLDPVSFLPESLIGIPNLMAAYRAGNVALINAPGNGAADDKGIYYFVPKMIKYYLGEEPILRNAPTYLPYYEEDLKYVLAHMKDLVVKNVAEDGGYGVVFAGNLGEAERQDLADRIKANPRGWIAQEIIDFKELPVVQGTKEEYRPQRKADLRAFVLTGKETVVWPSGLTRYARDPGSAVVNSSQGGGFKDTWVLSQ